MWFCDFCKQYTYNIICYEIPTIDLPIYMRYLHKAVTKIVTQNTDVSSYEFMILLLFMIMNNSMEFYWTGKDIFTQFIH